MRPSCAAIVALAVAAACLCGLAGAELPQRRTRNETAPATSAAPAPAPPPQQASAPPPAPARASAAPAAPANAPGVSAAPGAHGAPDPLSLPPEAPNAHIPADGNSQGSPNTRNPAKEDAIDSDAKPASAGDTSGTADMPNGGDSELDVDMYLRERPVPETAGEALHALDDLVLDVARAVASASTLKEQVRQMERLLRVKEAQLTDAKNASAALEAGANQAQDAVTKMRKELAEQRSSNRELASRLQKGIDEENTLEKRIVDDDAKVEKLKKAVVRARRDASDPALSRLVERSAESFGRLIDSQQSAELLGQAAAKVVEDTRISMEKVEKRVRKEGVSRATATLLTSILVVAPSFMLYWACKRITMSLSYRQHVMLGHLLNAVVLAVCAGLTLATGYDPLVAIHKTWPVHSILIAIFFIIQWPVMVMMMVISAVRSPRGRVRHSYISQVVLFSATCTHVSRRAHVSILKNENGRDLMDSNFAFYMLYLFATVGMIVLTVASLESAKEGLVSDVRNIMVESVDAVEDAAAQALGTNVSSMTNSLLGSHNGCERGRFARGHNGWQSSGVVDKVL